MDGLVKKVVLGVAVSLGVAASTAALYFVFKDDFDDPDLDKNRTFTSRQTTVKVRIRKDAIGAVIGRGGETVRRIQNDTKTRITFEGTSDDEERFAIIRGSPETCLEAEQYILSIIDNQPIIFTEEVLIPYSCVGMVIGRNGENIKSICSTSQAKVKVARLKEPPANDLNPVTISGTPDQISAAKNLIDEMIAENEQRYHGYSVNQKNSNFRGRGRPLAIEQIKQEDWDDNEPPVEELVATAENGFLEVYVSAVESPSRFWVQVFGPKGTELDKLSDAMTDFYEVEANRTRTSMSSLPLKVGDIVAAPYSLDENFYRVRIVEIKEDSYAPEETPVKVFYLDFGDEHTHPKKSLCTLKEEFLTVIPFQAIECRLNAVYPKNLEWSEEAIKLFVESTYAAQWKQILAKPVKKVRHISGKGIVNVVDLSDVRVSESGVNNIAEALIARGLAEANEENGSK